jgi:hypothetical protein
LFDRILLSKKSTEKKNDKGESMSVKQKKSIAFRLPAINPKHTHAICIGVLFLILAIAFFRMAFLGYAPPASDTIQWRAAAQSMKAYNETHRDQALWNSNLFSGMPGYLTAFGSKYPFINTLRKYTDHLMNWRVFLLFTAGLGMYLLMIHLGFDPLTALLTALGFALTTHFLGLIEIGHNSKFKATIYLPWVIFGLLYLKERKSLLSLGLLSMFLIGQLRENHPQISYYTFMFIGIYWIFSLIWAIKDKKVTSFLGFTGLLAAAVVISALAVAQPYMSTWEYGEYTIRGGSSGLDAGYATGWSFHPLEMISWIVPNFFGGVSPYYWGWMPFQQVSTYMGIFILLLAITAVIYSRHRLVHFLIAMSAISILISFGRHLPFLSNLLLAYLPGFNKFRIPSMINLVVAFNTVILAGFGVREILARSVKGDERLRSYARIGLYVGIGVLILFLAGNGIFGGMKMMHAGDAGKYNPNQLQALKEMRLDLLVKDGILAGVWIIVFFGLLQLHQKNTLKKYVFMALLFVFAAIDLFHVNSRFLQNLQPKQAIAQHYNKTQTDSFLLKDKELFRVYPLGREFGQNRWCYYQQSIGGYHAAKLKRYQEIIEHCLNAEFRNNIPINWNIVNMLNAKYVIFNQKIPLENLEYAHYDSREKLTTYKNSEYLPRAWFVQNTELIQDKQAIWRRLNDLRFNPATTAIVEDEIPAITAPKTSSVTVTEYDLHNITLQASCDTTSFMVLSEVYYPAGWTAEIDGTPATIYPTNYILRGIVVPAGEHTITFRFDPPVYRLSLILSATGLLVTIILLIVGGILYYRKNYRGEIEYVIKR